MKRVVSIILIAIFGWSLFEGGALYYNQTATAESASDVRRQIVVDFLKEVILPKVEDFVVSVNAFDQSVGSTCSSNHNLSSLRNDMEIVYSSYGFLEAVKFGALADPVKALDIEINPLLGDFSACIIDKQVSKLAKNPEKFKLDTVRKSRKGLSAIEYLITDTDLNHACSQSVPQTKKWNDLAVEKKKEFRCGYLKHLSADLKLRADQLLNEWSSSQGDLVGDIDRNEMGNTSQDLLNQVADSLYFLERFLKDSKIANPIGLKEDCSGKICVQEFERPTLKASITTVSQNLNGFLSVFIGNLNHSGEKKGFYSLLAQLGRNDIAEELYQSIFSAKQAADLILDRNLTFEDIKSEGFKNCLNAERSSMCDIFTPVQKGTLTFKTDFYSILNLRKPDGIPVDND